MKTYFVNGQTLPEAYHMALTKLDATAEKEITVMMKVLNPLQEPMISKCGIFGPRELEQYRQEMLYGILDFEVERGNWHYTYHQRMAEWKLGVIDELKRDPDSRRAVIAIRDNEKDMTSGDPACLQTLQYMIRDGKLHCWVMFRSNDAVKACFMNMFALVMLQKEFADALGVPVGSYTHIATSWHCYPQDEEMLHTFVKNIAQRDCTYRYDGGWKELMEAEQDSINEMVHGQYAKYMSEKIDKRAEILRLAEHNVCGHRVQDYGKPENNFDVIAKLWTAYTGIEFTAENVAMMMALMKIGRITTGTGTEDSFVDACGYLACAAEIGGTDV